MRIITNADDFGLSSDTVRATIECFEAGALTSASIMPKMPATDEAAAYARSRPDLSFGVHLTFVRDTVEAPVLPAAELPTLVGADGGFMESQKVRLLALARRLSVEEIAREARAQILSLRERGVEISHVDSHGHLHKFAPFRRALVGVLGELGITKVRSAQNIYLKKPLKSPNFWLGPYWRRALKARFRSPDDFFMPTSAWDAEWAGPVLGLLKKESCEVGVHPGYEEAWRDQERRAVQAFAKAARERGHKLIGWKSL